ncbi:unnamed protein product [Soboliphyme baturini]|uniref:GDE_C domain-containing protein n=1 Tax=Soboliphyme baturini TaxID=241478 RepID=A0A183J954_9BILA|nr:unnamed protein product [Soboliphyme baturini]
MGFRERNAGREIDEYMLDKGFDIEVGVDLSTGFVHGGNEWNCGTWMDKMGSSDKAGNRGKPATPRDGSAVEIVGLSFTVLAWLHKMHTVGKYKHRGVSRNIDGAQTYWTWQMWSCLIRRNFERCFWIPINDSDIQTDVTDPKLATVRGIYKDTFGGTHAWADYQFRPNFTVSIVVAPELFSIDNATCALRLAEEKLLGKLGMKTLIERHVALDWAYDGYYDNADDSSEYGRARGFNYHQGPEWLWLTGYFLRALLVTAKRVQNEDVWKETVAKVERILSRHSAHMHSSPWSSLPELTNKVNLFPFSYALLCYL